MSHHHGDDDLYPVNPKYCGRDWQLKYQQFHRSVMSLEASPEQRKFVVSVPVRAGGADNMLGIISLFLYSLIIQRAFLRMQLTLEGYHAPIMDHAYIPATFNWTAPAFNESITACMFPPYDGTMYQRRCENGPMHWLPNDPKEYSLHHYFMVNSYQKERFWYSDYNTMLGTDSDKDAIFVASNRGNVYMTFFNPHHNVSLINDYGLSKETAFSCLFNYLFKLKPNVCIDGCKKTLTHIRRIKKNRKLIQTTPFPIYSHMLIAIQIRVRDIEHPDNVYFHCADQLAEQYTAMGVHNVTFLFINPKVETQRMAHRKYGHQILFPTGEILPESPKDVLDESDKSDAGASDKVKAVIESARDWEIMSHADVHVVTSRSGFGVMGAMMRVRDPSEYRLFNTRDFKRVCKVEDPDPLQYYVEEWSGLR